MIKICTFQKDNIELVGVASNSRIISLNEALKDLGYDFKADSVKEFLESGNAGIHAAQAIIGMGSQEKDYIYDEADVLLMAPIPNPGKFICLAGNYMKHLSEHSKSSDVKKPSDIHVFTKSNTSIISPYDEVVMPESIERLDYELELGFIIGKKGKYIPEEKAGEHIAGYFVSIDITDRDFMPQVTGERIHWFAMKARDNSAPFGPYILLNDEDVSIDKLEMELHVNGELRQKVNPVEMVFKPEWIVSRLSSWVTLEPGDIVITGTPDGDGWSREKFLNDGDVLEAGMKHVGMLRNRIRFEEEKYRCN